MNSNVVFDEFHELLDIAGISLLFLEFMRLRATTEGSGVRTLLMSATPTPYLLDFFTDCENATLHPDVGFRKPLSQRVTHVPSFNTNDFVLKLGQYQMSGIHPFTQPNVVASGDIAVSNIVSVAQEATIKALSAEQPALTYHSKYTPNDKQTVLNRVLRLFGKHATAEQPALFAGPIVQASLNISTSTLHTDATTAENFLQRMGRVNRFGLLPSGTVVMYDCTTDNGVHHRVDNVLSKFNQKNRAQAWLDYCHANKLFTTLKLSDWYDHYWKFHTLPTTQASYKTDAAKVLAASVKLFQNNAFEPIQYFPKKISVQTKQLSKRSLRGRSFYACPRKIVYSNGKETSSSWLFTNASHAADMYSDGLTFLTYSPDFLSDASKYMKASEASTQAHRKGLSSTLFAKGSPATNPKKGSLWKQRAVSPDMPIILSFDKSHAHPEERIYVEYNQVIIGVMLKTNWLSCFPTSHQLTN
jgi:CRISPR-associated endonuclease/helicase Cas3